MERDLSGIRCRDRANRICFHHKDRRLCDKIRSAANELCWYRVDVDLCAIYVHSHLMADISVAGGIFRGERINN